MLTNAGARAGDVLVLTKPLGTGFVTTANKKEECPPDVLARAVAGMIQLNVVGRDALRAAGGAHAVTDVTGYGLAGHALEMAEGAGLTVEIDVAGSPLIEGAEPLAVPRYFTRASKINREFLDGRLRIEPTADPRRVEFAFDAQTSGGLLIAIDPDHVDRPGRGAASPGRTRGGGRRPGHRSARADGGRAALRNRSSSRVRVDRRSLMSNEPTRRTFLETAGRDRQPREPGARRRAAGRPAAQAQGRGRRHRLPLPLARLSHRRPIPRRLRRSTTAEGLHRPDFEVASLFIEQTPRQTDLGRDKANRHGVRLSPTIADALTLGTGKLAVDAVLLIGEHGDYPYNDKLQKLYPRGRFFRDVARRLPRLGRGVPVFIDKHLSYSRAEARQMVETARGLEVPAHGRLEPARHLAASRARGAAGPTARRTPSSPRGATSRSSASTPWKRSSAWPSAATARASRKG